MTRTRIPIWLGLIVAALAWAGADRRLGCAYLVAHFGYDDQLVAVADVVETRRTASSVECTGTATLADGTRTDIVFWASIYSDDLIAEWMTEEDLRDWLDRRDE